MGLQNYGVWKATPTSFKAQRAKEDPNSPHGYLVFQDGTSASPKLGAAINVKSISDDSRLVYWTSPNFTHPICQRVKALSKGWHEIGFDSGSDPERISLDLIRDELVKVGDGKVVPHDEEGEKNDIVDFMEPFFDKAIEEKATVYLWGEQYDGQEGIHDVHMNQGSSGRFTEQNGPNQDGGIILEFSDGHWEAFFLAFASQTVQTTSTGQPTGDTFAIFLNAPAAPGDSSGEQPPAPPAEPRPNGPVRIVAALVNPDGHDNVDNPERVHLKNKTCGDIELGGWTIENHLGDSFALPRGAVAATGSEEGEGFEVPGVPLSNKGGSIALKDAEGKVVDKVDYTKEQARKAGEMIRFG